MTLRRHASLPVPCLAVVMFVAVVAAIVADATTEDTYRGLCQANSPAWLPGSPATVDLYVQNGTTLILRNGFVCAVLELSSPSVVYLGGSWSGDGHYGHNSLSATAGGISLIRVDASGETYSSASTGLACAASDSGGSNAPLPTWRYVLNTPESIGIAVDGITDACGDAAAVQESWFVGLEQSSLALTFAVSGGATRTLLGGSQRSIAHRVAMRGSSVYGLFHRGVVQMRYNQNSSAYRYATTDTVDRLYALGGCCDVLDSAGNVSLSVVRTSFWSTAYHELDTPPAVALLSADNLFQPFWTGFEEYVVSNSSVSTAVPFNVWSAATDAEVITGDILAGAHWAIQWSLAPNNKDFPILPGSQMSYHVADDLPTLPTDAETQAMLTGIFASPVGNLFTHDNEVEMGYRVGQIATTIHRPDVGYADTYNYFDPDNYFSTFSMLSANDRYLHHEVRRVLERSGDFLSESGQLPHHFVGITPVYVALSGAIQTGPNIFWILSCLNYAKYSGDFEWLALYMPRLRNASAFLFNMIDPQRQLLSAPGSLYIDVFIRNNFTSDSNGMLVGFFLELAAAEKFVGNTSGAATLLAYSMAIAEAMNRLLMAETDDHYITQLNPDGSIRDFVDYDSNLISLAHGVPNSTEQAQRIMNRVDSGRCTHGRATFVSEIYYGPSDCVNGNIGDSWCSMGRNGWFDSLTRKRYNDIDTFNQLILDPLIADVNRWTWLWERYSCDGTPQLNRTWAYFEYPAVASIMVSYVRYGIQPGLGTFTVDPFRTATASSPPPSFVYRVGMTYVAFNSPDTVVVRLPPANYGPLRNTTATPPTRRLTITQLAQFESYSITNITGCSSNATAVFLFATYDSDGTGTLTLDVPVSDFEGVPCTVTVARAGGASSSSGSGPQSKQLQTIAGSVIGALACVAVIGTVVRWRYQAKRHMKDEDVRVNERERLV